MEQNVVQYCSKTYEKAGSLVEEPKEEIIHRRFYYRTADKPYVVLHFQISRVSLYWNEDWDLFSFSSDLLYYSFENNKTPKAIKWNDYGHLAGFNWKKLEKNIWGRGQGETFRLWDERQLTFEVGSSWYKIL